MSRLSSLFIRSAVVTQASVSATSLLCSIIGTTQLQNTSVQSTPISPTISSALPWIDELHNIVSFLYVDNIRRPGSCPSRLKNGSKIQLHPDASLENPIVCYSGISEIVRIFRARSALSLRDDKMTLLKCIRVDASEDSITGGKCNNSSEKNNTSPPTVQVIYRLQRTYGSLFSLNSMLKITVQVQRSITCRTIVLPHLPERAKTGVLATSGLSKNVLGLSNTTVVGLKCVLAGSWWRSLLSDRMDSRNIANATLLTDNTNGHQSFVAQVVKIEECWNEVELVKPFHLSRRINGLMVGGLAYVFSFIWVNYWWTLSLKECVGDTTMNAIDKLDPFHNSNYHIYLATMNPSLYLEQSCKCNPPNL